MDTQIRLLLSRNKQVSDNQLMISFFLSYKSYFNQCYLLQEIISRAYKKTTILDIYSPRGKNVLMTMIRNIFNYSYWKLSHNSLYLSLLGATLKIISLMTEEQLNYQFSNYSRVITYQQDIRESHSHGRETPGIEHINMDDNLTQDKILPGDTSLIYALRLWPASEEIIWSLLNRNIIIKPHSFQIWSYLIEQSHQIISQEISEIPQEQLPIQIVWKNWKYYKTPKKHEMDIYYRLLISCGKENIPSGVIRDGQLPDPYTHLGKVYQKCVQNYLIQQTFIKQTCLPTVVISYVFKSYLGWIFYKKLI